MGILAADNHGSGPDPNAAPVHVAVTAHPKATTVVSRAAEIQAATNKAYGEHLKHVREIGRKYSDDARGEVVAPLLKAFETEPIWKQAIDAETEVGQRVAELARHVENERRALTPRSTPQVKSANSAPSSAHEATSRRSRTAGKVKQPPRFSATHPIRT
ncbi:hypothetical protein [Mycobacterium helveticum]|uniref:Uncharacterized protein n=1 Tax=Mycobacterium helveticum TaxID=2592811 RepID=A0A557XVI6_9MYCO|nr:hypothetical protein [Mycobacterium helveticum]TVS86039.1 hypothetical protein FPZ46_12625 [Mycobacterium helveticum]TVS90022.1 hypothetical protein FPZ47_10820 [Mycobacterium helveticum]